MPPPLRTPLPLHPSYNLPMGRRPILLFAEDSSTYFLFDHDLISAHPTLSSCLDARTTKSSTGDTIVRIPTTSAVLKFALDTLRYEARLTSREPFLRTTPESIGDVVRLDALGFPYILRTLSTQDRDLHAGWRFTLAVLAKDAGGVGTSWTKLVLHQSEVKNRTEDGRWYELLDQHATGFARQVDALLSAWNTHRANCNRHINRILATWHGRCGHTDNSGRLVPRQADWAKFIPRAQAALCVNGVTDDKLQTFRKGLRGVHCQTCQDYLTCAITREWLVDRSQRKFDGWYRELLESLELS